MSVADRIGQPVHAARPRHDVLGRVRSILAPIALVIIGGCASTMPSPTVVTTGVTPERWASASTLVFAVSDRRGKSLGSFTLELTSQPARTCLGGEYLEAIPKASDLVIPGVSLWWQDKEEWPSYRFVGNRLDVELNGGGFCDDYTSIHAVLGDVEGTGTLASEGLFGGTRYGTVVVKIAPEQAPPTVR